MTSPEQCQWQLPQLSGAEISVTESYGAVTINEATVVAADIEASNGVIHVIDQVLLP
ncbi:MAG: fasciclin domain-containing protein [Acidimicrobiales bacterium]